MAAFIEQDGLIESRKARFVAGQGTVDVRSADLSPRWNGIVLDSPPGAHASVNALVAMQIIAKRQGDQCEGILVICAHSDWLRAFVSRRAHVALAPQAVPAH